MIMTIKKWFNIIPFFVKAAVSAIENGGFFVSFVLVLFTVYIRVTYND